MSDVSVGLSINQDLTLATKQALQNAEKNFIGEPSGILYFTGTHHGGKKVYNRAMEIIKKKHPKVPLSGCSGVGIANNSDYGLKGAAIVLFSNIRISTHLVKRFRIRTGRKTKKVINNCLKIEREELRGNASTSFVFFPPGLGFPKIMVNLLNHRLEGINPFFVLNNRIWRDFPIISSIAGTFVDFMMNILGIGISYSCAWPLFCTLYEKGIHFTGSFGVDPLTMNKSYQFYNFKAYKDSLSYFSISSSELSFESQTDNGAEVDLNKQFDVDSYLNGGFIPRIQGQWGAQSLLKLYDMENTPEVLEECTQKYFYYHPFKPLCVVDSNNQHNLYALSINPNIKHALITAPNQVVKKLHSDLKDHYSSYICNQGAISIENLLKNSLSNLIDETTVYGLFFDCANRAMIVGDRFQQYIQHYTTALGDIPYLVVLSGGEVNSQSFPIVNFSLISSIAKRLPVS